MRQIITTSIPRICDVNEPLTSGQLHQSLWSLNQIFQVASWTGKIIETTVNGFGIINTSKLESRSPNTSRHRRHWPWPHRPPVTLEHLRALFRRLNLANTFVASTFCTACVLAFWSCGRETQSGAKSLDSSDCVQKTTETVPVYLRAQT